MRKGIRKRLTARERTLEVLRAHEGKWVSAVDLSRVSLAYGRVIHELRKDGCLIRNKIERQPDGTTYGYFRLEGELPHARPARPPVMLPSAPAPAAQHANGLFGDISPLRYPD